MDSESTGRRHEHIPLEDVDNRRPRRSAEEYRRYSILGHNWGWSGRLHGLAASSRLSRASTISPTSGEYPDTSTLVPSTTIPCGICAKPFDARHPASLFAHLSAHFDQRYDFNKCGQCLINFVCRKDLQTHLLNVTRHHDCGFMFEHRQSCPGHHPPLATGKDGKRFDFCYRLPHWEHAQLDGVDQSRKTSRVISTGGAQQKKKNYFPSRLQPRWLRRHRKLTASSHVADRDHAVRQLLSAGLLRAVCTGNHELVTSFLCAGASVHFKDTMGFNAMHYAAQYASPELAYVLVRHGADIEEPDGHQGMSPLSHAVAASRESLVLYLISWGAQLTAEDLVKSVTADDVEVAEILVEHWKHCWKPMAVLDDLLLLAVKLGHVSIVELLLGSGARSTTKDDDGCSALSIALAAHDKEIARLLLNHGSEPDGWFEKDDRPLSEVINCRHLAMLESLWSKPSTI